MKKLLLGLSLIISTFVASAAITQDYSVSFSSRFSDSRWTDTGCGAYIVEGGNELVPKKDVTAIRIKAEGTGHWVDFVIPVNRIPLKNGDSFIVKQISGDKIVKYNNGILSVELVDINEFMVSMYWHDLGIVKVDPYLKSISYADVSYARVEKGLFGKKLVSDMRLKCNWNV